MQRRNIDFVSMMAAAVKGLTDNKKIIDAAEHVARSLGIDHFYVDLRGNWPSRIVATRSGETVLI